MDSYKKPCFDSSVFIAGLGDGEICRGIKRKVVFDWLWQKATDGAFEVYISSITLAEVYKTKRNSGTPTDGPLLDEFLERIETPFVKVIEIDRQIGLSAHALCRKFAANKLWPNDALHLACALSAGCDVLIAWDRPLVSVTHDKIRIEEPSIYEKDMLPAIEIASPEEIKLYESQIKTKVKVGGIPTFRNFRKGTNRRTEK